MTEVLLTLNLDLSSMLTLITLIDGGTCVDNAYRCIFRVRAFTIDASGAEVLPQQTHATGNKRQKH